MSSYGQFCPVAKACELLCERWTLLVVRELVCGSRHFNDLRRGVPRMSPALLARRLRQLEHNGIVRRLAQGRRGSAYELTQAGHELRPLVERMGSLSSATRRPARGAGGWLPPRAAPTCAWKIPAMRWT